MQTGLFTAPFDPLGLRNDYRRQSEVRPVKYSQSLQNEEEISTILSCLQA
jgi:hypothetical protein